MSASERATQLATIAAQAAEEKLASSIVALDVSDQMPLTDIFVIVSADNERQVAAMVEEIEDRLRVEADIKPLRREGDKDARWVLLDFGDIVVHAQHDDEREYYELARLWKDCPVIDLGVSGQPDES
ncbi:ribosome silencing factor [Janibacter sp. GXQ6167]|uniref:ribosome silencing factor n=1 Tax=Janibacter sp. GXQ6167 TaxID=3240791 RepID=UPI003523F52E